MPVKVWFTNGDARLFMNADRAHVSARLLVLTRRGPRPRRDVSVHSFDASTVANAEILRGATVVEVVGAGSSLGTSGRTNR